MYIKRKHLTENDKKLIGCKCCNCGKTVNLEYHHIVPLSFGGSNMLSNFCCLCTECHCLIHFGRNARINHSELTKKGIQRAKANGKQIGQKKGNTLITKKSIEMKKQILKYSKAFGGTLNDTDCIKLLGIARNSYYKYKKELKTD